MKTSLKNFALIKIRKASAKRDLARIVEIEEASFDDPYDAETLEDDLNQCYVATVDGKIAGYVYFGEDDADYVMCIDNIAVAPEFRRRGVGTSLIKFVKRVSEDMRAVETVVREYNLDAQLFFRKQGFSWVQTLSWYYMTTDEDAYVMECEAI